jgi:hypothetical protein
MTSRWIINLLLLVAIAILALVAWYEPGLEETPEPQALTRLQPDQINSIHIERQGGDDLVLSRQDDGDWGIEREPALPADAAQVEMLSRLATQTPARSYPATELELARLGLDPPHSTVVLNDARIDFGDTEPLGGLRYVRTADQVHLISDIYQYLIDADFTQFVRRRLLPEAATVTALRLPHFSLTRNPQAWTIEPDREVSGDRLQRLIDNWRQAAALNIRAAAGADAEGESVILSLDKPARELVFVIAAREPELVLVRPDLGLEYRMGNVAERLLALPTPAAAAGE